MELDRELETFGRELPRLLESHRGEYALVYEDTIAGFFKTDNEAYEEGCRRFGLVAFLVKCVESPEKVIRSFHEVIPRDAELYKPSGPPGIRPG
jgi:hypothetical protein